MDLGADGGCSKEFTSNTPIGNSSDYRSCFVMSLRNFVKGDSSGQAEGLSGIYFYESRSGSMPPI